ncbi:MAG: LysR family glycine cleavage system transcriptional activator [Paracoccaceae bacterium]|jgi:LysR family glycine cleavage system transcriptional activator
MRNLPSLNGVRAFEAAARCGSFKKAAEELNVTPAAISRLVKLLEERLEVPLFLRNPNNLTLTPAGAAYQPGLTAMLDSLAALTDRVKTLSGREVLTVGVGPTFAIRWLIPRLAAFQTAQPGIDVRITTGGEAVPFGDDWTCSVTLGTGDWPGLRAEPLFTARLTPVCTPALAEKLKAPANLHDQTLLRVRVSHAVDDWQRWFDEAGEPDITADGPEVGYYDQSLQAAVDGVGVAMGITPYVDDDLAAGRLVAPFDIWIPKKLRWYLVYREARADEPAFAAFRNWIREAANVAG